MVHLTIRCATKIFHFQGNIMILKNLSVAGALLLAADAFSSNDEVIVTGTYSPIATETIASSVSVINREELLALSQHSLVDALRQIPSLWVEEQGGPGGITGISLRGAESNHTLVLLDGVQLNDPTNTRGGAFDVNNINIDSIKRIEIIRGAQSSIYGSDALAGVIHIITLEPGKLSQQNMAVSVGDYGYKTASVTTSGNANSLGYAFKIETKDAGEPIKGSSAKNKEALAKIKWQEAAHQINFSFRYLDGEKTNFPEQSGGPLFAIDRNLDSSEFTDQNAALSWRAQINQKWRSELSTAWFNRSENSTSPGIFPYLAVPPNGADTDFSRNSVKWVNTLGDEKIFWSNIGAETKYESGESKGYLDLGLKLPTDFSLNRRTNSAFFNINGYATSNTLLQASIRRDQTEHLAANNSAQLGTRIHLTSEIDWYLNLSKGFKLPSFFALGHPLVGNPELKPELVKTNDTGFTWTRNNAQLNLSYFNNHYQDLIDFDNTLFKNVNRDKVDISGVDLELNWQSQNRQWKLGAHASYADIDAENPLLGRPQVKSGATIGYRLNEHWNMNLNYLWVDERLASSLYTGDTFIASLSNYNRLDANLTWSLNSQMALSLSIENMANEVYQNDVGFPAIERRGFATLRINF